MLTLLSAIFGFVSSFLPNVFKMLENKQNHAYDLEIRNLDIKRIELVNAAAAKNLDVQKQLEELRNISVQDQVVHQHDIAISNDNSFFGQLRSSIRPIITYTFFGLFVAIKIAFFVVAWQSGLPLAQMVPIIWDDTTAALFGSIMGFWFGGRGSDKLLESTPTVVPNSSTIVKGKLNAS